MEIRDLLGNQILINSMVAWAAAQVIKSVIYAIINKTFDVKRLLGDGGMPSGHSATVSALAATTAIEYGFASAHFAISFILAVIVMHDAMGVRLEAGKHAKAINELLATMSSNINSEEKLKEFVGHTPLQVCFGALLGLITAISLT